MLTFCTQSLFDVLNCSWFLVVQFQFFFCASLMFVTNFMLLLFSVLSVFFFIEIVLQLNQSFGYLKTNLGFEIGKNIHSFCIITAFDKKIFYCENLRNANKKMEKIFFIDFK